MLITMAAVIVMVLAIVYVPFFGSKTDTSAPTHEDEYTNQTNNTFTDELEYTDYDHVPKIHALISQTDKLIDKDPNNSTLFIIRGTLNTELAYSELSTEERIGYYSKALKDINHAIELAPQTPHAYIARAKFYMRAKKLDDAYFDIEEAIKLDPENADEYQELLHRLKDIEIEDEKYEDLSKWELKDFLNYGVDPAGYGVVHQED